MSGLVAGIVMLAGLGAVQVFWSKSAQPVVVVVREEARPSPAASSPAAAQAPAVVDAARKVRSAKPPAPESSRPSTRGEVPVTPAAERRAPARATVKPAPKIEVAAAAASDGAPAAPSPKREGVDEAFMREFTPPPDELQTSEIFEVVAAHRAEVDACVRQHRARAPDVSGRLVMRWTVHLDGHVSGVEARDDREELSSLARCLETAISGWRFPKHEVARGVVEVPFVF